MNKENIIIRDVKKHCDICGKIVFVDQFGQGECKNCSWQQSDRSFGLSNLVIHPNVVSLSKARELIKQGKPIEPSFSDFIEMFKQYGEVEFYYDSKHYGMMNNTNGIDFYEWDVIEGFQTYNNINEFIKNANIKGVLLSDLWKDVKNANYM